MSLATLKRNLKLATKLPFREFIKKVGAKGKKASIAWRMRRRDLKYVTYGRVGQSYIAASLSCRFSVKGLHTISTTTCNATLLAITDRYLIHRFDLLGSGWVMVCYGMECTGLEGYKYAGETAPTVDGAGQWLFKRINSSNLAYSRHVWSLVDKDYSPIDWHIDFKSGYRWKEDTWYKDITFAHLPGVDVKVPWELARMQHLPQLARAYASALAGVKGFSAAHIYIQEFRNQVLDFIALNPPRFGVNWVCSMDVGIRVANWLLAYDLFTSTGEVFDEEFNKIFKLSVYQHGKHITNNLEWHPLYRGNHYLADIVGLLFVASYLDSDPEIDAWLAFGVQELIAEVEFQFYAEGANFEASTSYHRLSAELVAYATALIVGLPDSKQEALGKYDHRYLDGVPALRPKPTPLFQLSGTDIQSPFPDWYWQRLEGMARFTAAVMRPDGQSPQIGDNDSGRLFKLTPLYKALPVTDARRQYANIAEYRDEAKEDEVYWLELHNDHRHLLAVIYRLCGCESPEDVPEEFKFEGHLIEALARNLKHSCSSVTVNTSPSSSSSLEPELSLRPSSSQRYNFHGRLTSTEVLGLDQGLDSIAYPDFGLYLLKSERVYLAVRCGAIGLNGLGAHAHNDPLSIELWLDGQPVVEDAGTYLYTSLPSRRDEFRSVAAHFSPRFEGVEPGDMTLDVFKLGDEAKCECLRFGNRQFLGRYSVGAVFIYRHILIGSEMVEVTDWVCEDVRPLIRLDPQSLPYSPGYGWRSN